VWVDSLGRLNLKLTFVKGRWYCAEVVNTRRLGYGRYGSEFDSPVDALDPNVVWGRVHLERRSGLQQPRAGHRVQPLGQLGRPDQRSIRRPTVRPPRQSATDQPAHRLLFYALVRLAAERGDLQLDHRADPWTYSGSEVPQPGSEQLRINLWLFRGAPPTDGKTVEVIVKRFTFTPAQ